MKNTNKENIVKKIMPEVFLKKILSYPYENIGNFRIFYITDALDIEQIQQSRDISVCSSIENFKQNLETETKNNLYISQYLINRTLLENLLRNSAQSKNIFWGSD